MSVSAQKSRILVGDFSMTANLTEVKSAEQTAALEVSTLADTSKQFILGQTSATLSMTGYYDEVLHADAAAWTAAGEVFSYAPQGFTLGNEVWMEQPIQTTFETTSSETGVVGFSISAQPSGPVVFGRSLHDLTAETGTVSSSSYDGGAASTGGAIAHLHVTAYSGLTNVVFTVEDSANNSAFSTIGTFATVSGKTAERITIAGTVRRYLRVTATVTGTGSITYAVAAARL